MCSRLANCALTRCCWWLGGALWFLVLALVVAYFVGPVAREFALGWLV